MVKPEQSKPVELLHLSEHLLCLGPLLGDRGIRERRNRGEQGRGAKERHEQRIPSDHWPARLTCRPGMMVAEYRPLPFG